MLTKETRAAAREDKRESLFSCLSRLAPSVTRFARQTKNKERLVEIYRGYIPELVIIELFIVNVSSFACG